MDEAEGQLYTVPPDAAPQRIDAWLAAATGLSRARIQSLLAEGWIEREDGSVPDGKKKTRAGESFRVAEPPAAPVETLPQDIPLDIVFEDDSILVVNKPAGLVVHPAAGHPDGTLVNAVLFHCPDVLSVGGERRPGIVHRLDRDTSGLLVVAKTDAALQNLADAFRNGGVHKTYRAIVCGVPEPPEGHIEGLIGRSPYDRQKMAVVPRNGKFASTDYAVEEDFGRAALLSVRIHTGRTHQIRVHMKSIGCPVAGDRDYGSPSQDTVFPFRPARQMLHAWRLELAHPITGEPLSFEAPLPDDFQELLEDLRKGADCIP